MSVLNQEGHDTQGNSTTSLSHKGIDWFRYWQSFLARTMDFCPYTSIVGCRKGQYWILDSEVFEILVDECGRGF